MQQHHPQKTKILTIMILPILTVISITIISFISIKSSQTSSSSSYILSPQITSFRILEQQSTNQSTDTNFWNPTTSKSNIYIILLIIGLSLLVAGSVAFCIILVVRYVRNGNHVHNARIIKETEEIYFQMIFPEVEYGVFQEEIGRPLHEACVICLEPYSSTTSTISRHSINSNPIPQQPQPQKSLVSLTLCGHLLHTKCLKQWIQRQPNCPLCRQEFNDENLCQWEQKINIDFHFIYGFFQEVERCQRKGRPHMTPQVALNIAHRLRNTDNSLSKLQSSIRDSTQINWLKLYNNRPIINPTRHKKYNLTNILNFISKNTINSRNPNHKTNTNIKKNRMIAIHNDSSPEPIITQLASPIHRRSISSRRPSQNQRTGSIAIVSTLKINKKDQNKEWEDGEISDQAKKWLYSLVVYAAIMDYHEGKGQRNVGDSRLIEEAS